ncbi:MAG TPA: hypothetical protein VMQ62_04285 [Dongiaceae bacterium]|nr:hypothetical protein [Dongiaceae bacterium]
MIYDREKATRMLKVALEVTAGALDLAARPGGEPSLRLPAMQVEKTLRTLAAKGDVDAMYGEYLRALNDGNAFGQVLERVHQKSLESEFYRFVKLYWERD